MFVDMEVAPFNIAPENQAIGIFFDYRQSEILGFPLTIHIKKLTIIFNACTLFVQFLKRTCNKTIMSIFKNEIETKRVIFNVRMDLAERLEQAKNIARSIGKKLDVDTAIDKALDKFLKKAEKKLG